MDARLTIVVIATNSDYDLRTTLRVLKYSVAGVPFESIVVANGVAPGSWLASLPFPSEVLRTKAAVSPGSLLNDAIAHAEGKYIAFFPAGAVPERYWPAAVGAAFDNDKVAAVAPRLVDRSGTRVRACGSMIKDGRIAHAHAGFARDAMYVLRPMVLDLAPLCGIVIRREQIAKVGAFDTDFATSLFEYDWTLRARLKGLAVAYRPDYTLGYDGPLPLGRNVAERSSAAHFFARWQTIIRPALQADVFLP